MLFVFFRGISNTDFDQKIILNCEQVAFMTARQQCAINSF